MKPAANVEHTLDFGIAGYQDADVFLMLTAELEPDFKQNGQLMTYLVPPYAWEELSGPIIIQIDFTYTAAIILSIQSQPAAFELLLRTNQASILIPFRAIDQVYEICSPAS